MASATMAATERTVVAPGRVQSVDVLRGLTIALMILVNDPGDWAHVFAPLDHAEWNGWTVTDLVFPTFLFLMGMSMVFSQTARAARGDCWKSRLGHVWARAGKIFLLYLVLAYFPRMHWQGLRLYGVLPRIALCSLAAGMVLIGTEWVRPAQRRVAVLAGLVAALLLGYWLLLRWVPVPGLGMPGRDMPLWDKNLNLAAWLDRGVSAWLLRWVHAGSLYKKTRDPEGLLSTLPAVATTLLGSLAGIWMRSAATARRLPLKLTRQVLGLAAAGVVAFGLGELWSVWFPINKNLWTSSYVLLAAGCSCLLLAGLGWLLEGREQPWPRWLQAATWPWRVFGANAIAAFTTSIVLVKMLLYLKIADSDGDRHSWLTLIYENVFARNGSNEWTSLAFAVSFVVVCFLPVWWMWRRRWFWKL